MFTNFFDESYQPSKLIIDGVGGDEKVNDIFYPVVSTVGVKQFVLASIITS